MSLHFLVLPSVLLAYTYLFCICSHSDLNNVDLAVLVCYLSRLHGLVYVDLGELAFVNSDTKFFILPKSVRPREGDSLLFANVLELASIDKFFGLGEILGKRGDNGVVLHLSDLNRDIGLVVNLIIGNLRVRQYN